MRIDGALCSVISMIAKQIIRVNCLLFANLQHRSKSEE
jgi:hypothetical protein